MQHSNSPSVKFIDKMGGNPPSPHTTSVESSKYFEVILWGYDSEVAL